METRLWINKGYRNFTPDSLVASSRMITSFATHNSLRDCLVKAQGGWYKIHKNGIMTLECRTLHHINLRDLYNILKD